MLTRFVVAQLIEVKDRFKLQAKISSAALASTFSGEKATRQTGNAAFKIIEAFRISQTAKREAAAMPICAAGPRERNPKIGGRRRVRLERKGAFKSGALRSIRVLKGI